MTGKQSGSGSGSDDEGTTQESRLAALRAIAAAFDRHDIEAIMEHMADDVVFESPRGPEAYGQRFVGRDAVREAFIGRFTGIPDVRYRNDSHFVAGDRGVSEWTIRGTQVTGEPIEVRGCDLFEFTDGKISRKDSFWKIVD